MGSICSCLCGDDFEDYVRANASIHRHCVCVGRVTQRLLRGYTALFRRGEVRGVPSSVEVEASLDSAALVTENSLFDTYCSPPRPLPYDDPRFSRLQHGGLVSRHDKFSGHFQEESELLRSNSETDVESKTRREKLNRSNLEGGPKLCSAMSSVNYPLGEVSSGAIYYFSSEDDDVCPTCLEEYTSENPRIVMQCSHHFHLGCIYEWMERSESCPVCGKVMVFKETS